MVAEKPKRPETRVHRLWLGLWGLVLAPLAGAQSAGAGLGALSGDAPSAPWRVTPTLNAEVSLSDNVRLTAGETQSDARISVDPGLSMSGRTARGAGQFQVRLKTDRHSSAKDLNRSDVYANGNATFDLYERVFLLDASAVATRNRASIFAPLPSTGYDPNGQVNTQAYTLSPYLRWQSALGMSGLLRYRATLSDGQGDVVEDYLRHDLELDMSRRVGSGPFAVSLQARHALTDYRDATDLHASSVRGNLLYAFNGLFRLRATVGYEKNDFVSSYASEQVIYGGGFDWTPSPRTRLSAQIEERFFGQGYNLDFSWRGARSSVGASFVRDVSSQANTLGADQIVGLLLAYNNALVREYPDPAKRAAKLNDLWRARGLPTTLGADSTYVSNAYYIEERATLSAAWLGTRQSVGVTGTWSERERLSDAALLPPTDDLASFGRTRDFIATAFANHALTPLTSMGLSLEASQSVGLDAPTGDASTRRRSASLNLTSRLGLSATGGFSYRYDVSRGVTQYRQQTVAASVGLAF